MNNFLEILSNVLDKEIEWSTDIENQIDSNITPEQAEWYIKGVKAAKDLIREVGSQEIEVRKFLK